MDVELHGRKCECCEVEGPPKEDLHRDELRPRITIDGFAVDYADHKKVVAVDEKEWDLYSNYITTLEEHKVWKVEDDKRIAEEARI